MNIQFLKDNIDKFKFFIRLLKGQKYPIDTQYYDKHFEKEYVLDLYRKSKIDIGLPLLNDYVVIDIDPRNEGQTEYDDIDLLSTNTLIQKTAGGGYHLFFNFDGSKYKFKKFKGIDILYGRKFVKYYGTFLKEVPIADFSEFPKTFIDMSESTQIKLNDVGQKNIKIKLDDIKSILNYIHIDTFNKNNNDWFSFCAAIMSIAEETDEDEVKSLLLDWSSQDTNYSLDEISKRLETVTGEHHTYRTILYLLNRHNQFTAHYRFLNLINSYTFKRTSSEMLVSSYRDKIDKIIATREKKIKIETLKISQHLDATKKPPMHLKRKLICLDYLCECGIYLWYDAHTKDFLLYDYNCNKYKVIRDSDYILRHIEEYIENNIDVENRLDDKELNHIYNYVKRFIKGEDFNISLETTYLNFDNLTINTTKSGDLELLLPSSKCVTPLHIPQRLNIHESETPIFDNLIKNHIFYDSDPKFSDECYDFIIDLIAHIILPVKLYPKIFLFFGSGLNGKSLLAEFIMTIIGSNNSLTLQIEDITNPKSAHSLASIVGKLVLIDDDLSIKRPLNTSILKSISESKSVTINPKYKDEILYRSILTPILLSNSEPKITDSTYGFVRRLVYIPFKNTLTGNLEIKPGVINRLISSGEIPKILGKAVKRIKNILNGEFRIPERFRLAKDDYLKRADSFMKFAMDSLSYDDESYAEVKDLFREFESYRSHYNIPPMSIDRFKRRLVELGYTERDDKVMGVRLNSDLHLENPTPEI